MLRGSVVLAVVALLAAAGCRRPTPVVLLTIDTLRPDHLSIYGYARGTDTAIASLAADAVVFARAFTTTPKTTPAHASMLTGLYPHRHGLTRLGQELAPENVAVAELLAEAGYTTAGFASSTVMIDRLTGLGQGFALWDDEMPSRERNRDNYERKAEATVERVLQWLERNSPPLFLFVHLIDPHGPYRPPSPYDTRFVGGDPRVLGPSDVPDFQTLEGARTLGDYVDAYDGEIAYADAHAGRLLAELRRQGLYDRSLIIVTADHGESFGEDGGYFRHGKTLEDVSTRVPLIVKPPGGRGGGVAPLWGGAVSLVDLVPTILDYTAIDYPSALDGVSLRPILEGKAGDHRRIVFSQRVGVGGVQRAAHGSRGSVMVFRCGSAQPERASMCERVSDAAASSGAVAAGAPGESSSQWQRRLRSALQRFTAEARIYRLPFRVRRRYRPGDKRFVELLVTEHNERWERYRRDDVRALRSLGYLE